MLLKVIESRTVLQLRYGWLLTIVFQSNFCPRERAIYFSTHGPPTNKPRSTCLYLSIGAFGDRQSAMRRYGFRQWSEDIVWMISLLFDWCFFLIWPIESRLSRSLKDHRNRHGSIHQTYDFILTFHSNRGPISYRFRDKRRFHIFGARALWLGDRKGARPVKPLLHQSLAALLWATQPNLE